MINSIQLLRVFAALGVVIAHYKLFGIKFGGFGVDIFFIISGFIISYVVRNNTGNFMKKRISRVVPLYTLATILTATLALLKPSWFKNVFVDPNSLFKSLLYIPYRTLNSGPILSLGWTLNNEMFFYLIVAVCILFIKNKNNILITTISVIFLVYVIGIFYDFDNYILNFFTKGLLLEFIYGVLLFLFWENYNHILTKKYNLSFILLGLISISLLIYIDVTGELKYFSRNIWRGIPSLFVVIAFLSLEKYINVKSKLIKFFIELGDSSYVMYLFHPYIIFGLTRVIYPIVFKDATSNFIYLVKFLLMLVILFISSIIIYRNIDKPLYKLARKILKV